MIDREGYFHRVQITHAMIDRLARVVNDHSGENWVIQFSNTFWFRVIDMTDPRTRRDYGWYESWDELISKVQRLFPGITLDEALTKP